MCALIALVLRYRRKYRKTILNGELEDVYVDVKMYRERKSEPHGNPAEKRISEWHSASVVELETLIGRDSSRVLRGRGEKRGRSYRWSRLSWSDITASILFGRLGKEMYQLYYITI